VKSRRVGSRIFLEGAVPTEQDYKRSSRSSPVRRSGRLALTSASPSESSSSVSTSSSSSTRRRPATTSASAAVERPRTSPRGAVVQNTTRSTSSLAPHTANATVVNQPLRVSTSPRARLAKSSSSRASSRRTATRHVPERRRVELPAHRHRPALAREREVRHERDRAPAYTPLARRRDQALGRRRGPDRTSSRTDRRAPDHEARHAGHVKLGQALILSASRRPRSSATSRSSWLSEIPVLGLLFATHAQEKQTRGRSLHRAERLDTVPKSALELINTHGDLQGILREIESLDTYPRPHRPRSSACPSCICRSSCSRRWDAANGDLSANGPLTIGVILSAPEARQRSRLTQHAVIHPGNGRFASRVSTNERSRDLLLRRDT